MVDTKVSIRISTEGAECVRLLARLQGTSFSDVIRKAALPVVRAQLQGLLTDPEGE